MTTGLDPAARRVAWDLIEKIRDRGTTVVLVTHFMDEAERLCDRVAVVDKGRIIAADTPRGLVVRYDPLEQVVFSCDLDGRGLAEPGAGRPQRHPARPSRAWSRAPGRCSRTWPRPSSSAASTPDDLRVIEPSLEDVFLKLTGHLVED